MPSRGSDNWTVKDVAESIAPANWTFPNDWIFWPPDVFALTSTIFQRTGCYSLVLSNKWESDPQWQADVEKAAKMWLERVSSIVSGETTDSPPADSSNLMKDAKLLKAAETIESLAPKVTIEQLQILPGWEDEDIGEEDGDLRAAQNLCEALILMHAVADEACSGLGLPASPRAKFALAHCLGNLLLTARGSLSAIPKHHGVVLPKLRTPQSGQTLRSFSHHVTWHSSEVEVMWRATPWANVEENTINILCLPWPSEISERNFSSEPETFEAVRYFRYAPPEGDNSLYLDKVVELVQHANTKVSKLHMVVFPETALSDAEYKELMWRLIVARRENCISHVPMIIAGVRNYDRKRGELNEVRLAAYFAGRWYDLSQRKHHRWKLDRNQIRQYRLEGQLATMRGWYENVSVAQRRLTFLAPTGWLAVCPLICEDLAQLEPVSELIRGVGPTLLVALLLDGPQLKERWSARYASVFADDPGTAVLTLTSIGMATRSRRLESEKPDEEPCRTVALWRDQVKGWETLDLGKGEDGILLTISADWREEYTADGRGDHQNAAAFKFEGARSCTLPKLPESDGGQSKAQKLENHEPQDQGSQEQGPQDQEKELLIGRWADIRVVTAATYALDAAIQLKGAHLDKVVSLLLGNARPEHAERMPQRISELIELVSMAEKNPADCGVAARQDDWPTAFLRHAVKVMREWLLDCTNENGTTANYWKRLAGTAADNLKAVDDEEDPDLRRAKRSIAIAILAALYYRLEKLRRRRPGQHGGERARGLVEDNSLTFKEASQLLFKIEQDLKTYS